MQLIKSDYVDLQNTPGLITLEWIFYIFVPQFCLIEAFYDIGENYRDIQMCEGVVCGEIYSNPTQQAVCCQGKQIAVLEVKSTIRYFIIITFLLQNYILYY